MADFAATALDKSQNRQAGGAGAMESGAAAQIPTVFDASAGGDRAQQVPSADQRAEKERLQQHPRRHAGLQSKRCAGGGASASLTLEK